MKRPDGDPRALGACELLAVAADQLAGQRPAGLRSERRVRRVAHLTVPVARRALLAGAVHLDLGGVQVDRHRLAAITPRFFQSSKPGPKGARKTERIRDRVLALRAQDRSVTEIAKALSARGTPVSAQTVWQVLATEGVRHDLDVLRDPG